MWCINVKHTWSVIHPEADSSCKGKIPSRIRMNTDQSSAIESMSRAGQWGWAQAQPPLTSQPTVKEPGQEGAALQLSAPPCSRARPLTAEWLAPSRAPRGTQPLLSLWSTGGLFCPYLWLCLNLGAEYWEGVLTEYCHCNTEWKLWSCHGRWAELRGCKDSHWAFRDREDGWVSMRIWGGQEGSAFSNRHALMGKGVWPKIPEKGVGESSFYPCNTQHKNKQEQKSSLVSR